MSSKWKRGIIESFWSLIKRHKYTAALRAFRSDKKNIFHNLSTLKELSESLQDCNSDNLDNQKYFILFILNNGLKDFLNDARNSRRWNEDKYDKNIMEYYDLLGYLLSNSQFAMDNHIVHNQETNLFELLIKTLDPNLLLGHPYLMRHLCLFWDYFMIKSSSKFVKDVSIHNGKLQFLIYFGFDTAIESIYLAMHDPKNKEMDTCYKFRGFILRILSTIYYYFSENLKSHFKLDNKQKIMDFIVSDYFNINRSNCNNYFLYSTEKSVAKFMSHSYNFGFFMNKMAILMRENYKSRSQRNNEYEDQIESEIREFEYNANIGKQRSVMNAQNIYRVLMPFEIILNSSHSKHKMEYFINILLTNLQRIWRINEDNQIIHNRFLYLTNDGNLDKKLGRYTTTNGNNYGGFEIIVCHLMDILLQNHVISYYQYQKRYLLQRSNKNEICNLLLSILDGLHDEQSKLNIDKSNKSNATINIQSAICKLCGKNNYHKYGMQIQEMNALKDEMMSLNMSLIGKIPLNVLNDIINNYQRTPSLIWHSGQYPLDVHKIILSYCDTFKCDPMIDTIKCGNIILYDINTLNKGLSSKLPEFIIDGEYVFDKSWIMCRVEDIIYGPMGNPTQLLIGYKIGNDNYGFLWITIEYIQWIEEYQRWIYNIIFNKKQNNSLIKCIFNTNLKLALFDSWYNGFVGKWIEEERTYKQKQAMKLKELKEKQQVTTATKSAQFYLRGVTKRQYKNQRK